MPRLVAIPLSLALLTPALAAQPIVSPAFYADEEGFLSSPYPFTGPSRTLQIHGDLIGMPRLLSGLAFRRDGAGSSGVALPSKSITLTVQMAPAITPPCDATFANNYAGAATQVFSGTISTPAAWATAPRQSPTAFDLAVAFTTPYAYAGTSEVLWDLQVTATSSSDRVSLDMAQSGFHLFTYGPYVMNGFGCTTPNGVMEMRANIQNQSFPPGVNYYWGTTGGPSNASAVLLLGTQQATVPIPGLCAPMQLVPLLVVAGTTDAMGSHGFNTRLPDSPALYATDVQTQLAALDPSQPTAIQVAVSNGVTARAAPLTPPAFPNCVVLAAAAGATSGSVRAGSALVVQLQ